MNILSNGKDMIPAFLGQFAIPKSPSNHSTIGMIENNDY